MSRRSFLAGVGGVSALSILAACSSSSSSSGSSSSAAKPSATHAALSDQLAIGWTADIGSMDPLSAATANARELTMNTYDQLVDYELAPSGNGTLLYKTLPIAPSLATSWTEQDGTVTFTLRQGVKFYPSGNVMTSADVKYTFDRALEAKNFNGAFDLNLAGIYKTSQIQVLGPYTVAITFTDPAGNPKLLPGGIPTLRYPQYGIMDSKFLTSKATADDPWAANYTNSGTAGTGPYYVASRTAGQQTVLKANPYYWNDKPDFTTLVFRVIGGGSMAALLKGGSLQFASQGLAPTDYDPLKSAGLNVQFQPIPQILRLDLAADDPALSDPQVRQAIAYAMPYNDIINVALKGRATRSYSYISSETPGYIPAMNKYTTDLSKAKALMSAAGAKNATVPFYYDSGVGYNQDVVLIIQQALAGIGITVTPEPQATATFFTDYYGRASGNNTQTGMAINTDSWWDEDVGSVSYAYVLKDSLANWMRFSDPAIDSLYTQYSYDTDLTARTAGFKQIQNLVADQVPFVPIANVGQVDVTAPGITNLPFVVDNINRFRLLKKS